MVEVLIEAPAQRMESVASEASHSNTVHPEANLPIGTADVQFKQTEAGAIPLEWSVSSVGKEFDIQLGKMLDSERNRGIRVPYLGNRAVQWGRFDVDELPYVAMSKDDLQRYRVRSGDLLVCEGGEVGRGAIWRGEVPECYYQKAIHRLRAKGSYRADLMLAYLGKWASTGLLANYVTQTSIAHLPKDKFETIPLPVPPPNEQEAIATALGEVDALIAALDRLIAKKRDLKQATLQVLLSGRTRLVGFSGDWCATVLGDVAEGFISGATPYRGRPNNFVGTVPWITSGELNYNVIESTREHVSREAVEQTNLRILPPRTFLFAITGLEAEGTRGSCALTGINATTNQSCMALFGSARLDVRYLFHYYVLRGKELALQYCQGTKQQSYTASIAKLLPIDLPPTLEEQKAIAAVLDAVNEGIFQLELRLWKTKAIKEGMMQELLTGRIRLA